MTTSIVKALDLERYARLLRGAAGVSCPVVFCPGAGEAVWRAKGSEDVEIETVLDELTACEEAAPAHGEARRVDLGRGRKLLYASGPAPLERSTGVLAVVIDETMPEDRLGPIETVLADLAACIEREILTSREADALAREVSTRYEELNLLYSLGGLTDSFEFGVDGARALLRSLSEGLEVDVAAFVVSTHEHPVYVAHPKCSIPNLDLVLTAMRGDLLRFATVRRNPIILNAPGDPLRQLLFVNMPYRVLACPVMSAENVGAMLVLLRVEDGPEFTNGDRNLGMVIANQAAIMMQNQRMVGSLQRFGEQAVGALIAAIESKDPYTRGHSERVQKVAVGIGKADEQNALTIDDISWGALLHDVGKIGIPDNIICKAGALSDDEYTMIKTHPERSYEILQNIGHLSRGSLEAARYHHERFDGTGYPHRLRGKAIPVESRIIAVADTYDALISSRSYRPGKDHESAMEVIREVAGTQLDGDFVQVFDNLCQRDAIWLKSLRSRDELDDG